MRTNRHKPGNMAVLVNTPTTGLRNFEDVVEAASLPCSPAERRLPCLPAYYC